MMAESRQIPNESDLDGKRLNRGDGTSATHPLENLDAAGVFRGVRRAAFCRSAVFDPAGDFDIFFCQLCRLWKTSEIPPADAAFFLDRLYSDRSVDDFPDERSVLPPK